MGISHDSQNPKRISKQMDTMTVPVVNRITDSPTFRFASGISGTYAEGTRNSSQSQGKPTNQS
jgi:hypothetical protein